MKLGFLKLFFWSLFAQAGIRIIVSFLRGLGQLSGSPNGFSSEKMIHMDSVSVYRE